MNKLLFQLLFIGVFTALSLTNSLAQNWDANKLDSFFNYIEAQNKGMGSIALLEKGNTIYTNAFGYADVENGNKATPSTLYRIGSITKTYTATIIMLLVEENKISLETKLSEYYPKVPNASEITIAQMLRHRSGIFNILEDSLYMDWRQTSISKEEMLRKIENTTPEFPPDSTMKYSNSGYILLGRIIEEIEDKSLEIVLKERILEPNGLKNTFWSSNEQTKNLETKSYIKIKDWEEYPVTDWSIPGAAGVMMATPEDVAKFVFKLFNNEIVSESSLKEMKKTKNGFGFGLFEMPFYDEIVMGHTGGIDGFQSIVLHSAENDLTICYMSNAVDIGRNKFLEAAYSIYSDVDYEFPSFVKSSYKPKAKHEKKYIGRYSAPKFPMKIDIFIQEGELNAQATGQSNFPLEPFFKHLYKFTPASIEIEFDIKKGQLILTQNGSPVVLTKE
jgi:D-alanyl-D-alanine carboxypeptidase